MILVIDNYDSFTYNLVQALGELGAELTVRRNDAIDADGARAEAVAGMAEACRALGTPVTGGNVSLYNETGGTPVYPTLVIGMVGLLDDLERRVPSAFQSTGDEIWVAGATREEIGGSEYLATCHGEVLGEPPVVDLSEAASLVDFLVAGAEEGAFRSAHDCADGGLSVALTECALGARDGARGFTADLDLAPGAGDVSAAALWFGESHSRVVLTSPAGEGERLAELAKAHGVPAARIGAVGRPGDPCRLRGADHVLGPAVGELVKIYESAIPRRMREEAGLTS